jgi:hypothetical protein
LRIFFLVLFICICLISSVLFFRFVRDSYFDCSGLLCGPDIRSVGGSGVTAGDHIDVNGAKHWHKTEF